MRVSLTNPCLFVALLTILQPAFQKSVETHITGAAARNHTSTRRVAANDVLHFPAEEQQSVSLDQSSFRSGIAQDLTPTPCPDGQAFCESADDYPKDYIKEILKKQPKFLLDHFYDEEEEIISDKFNPGTTDNPICPSQPKTVYPTKAQSKEGSYHFVVNDDENKQGVKVETCTSTGECKIPGSLSYGYTSRCVQRHIARTLVVLKKGGPGVQGFVTMPFEFPACCSCVISMTGDRFGFTPVNTNKTQP